MPTNPASPARNPLCPLTQFTRGLDLSGQNGNASVSGLHGAGGIGGLLAMLDTKNNQEAWDDVQHIYFHDANGNVGQVMDARAGSAYYGQAVARYEYYPFGGTLMSAFVRNSSGQKNPFLFSTKYRDSETGLYYYGERYLLPRLGRWLNRDPIGELGGDSLYAFVDNEPPNASDPFGFDTINWFDEAQQEPPDNNSCDICGPDVTKHVNDAMANINKWFTGLSPCQKNAVCNGIVQMGGWDIPDLHLNEVKHEGCGTGKCEGTVWVNGGCWHGHDVNYALWGLLNCRCQRWLTLEAAAYHKRVSYGEGLRGETEAWIRWGYAQGWCGSSLGMPKAEWDTDDPVWDLIDHPLGFRAKQVGTSRRHHVLSSCTSCRMCKDSSGKLVIWNGPAFRLQVMSSPKNSSVWSFARIWLYRLDTGCEMGGQSIVVSFDAP